MKIVLVNRFFWPDHSATSQLLGDLAFHLSEMGLSVHVVAGRLVYDDPSALLPSEDVVRNVRVIRVWTTRFGRHNLSGRTLDYLTFYLSAAWTLFGLLKPGDVVVAKTDPPLISVVAAAVARLRRAKLINWIQDLFPEVAVILGVPGVRLIGGGIRALRNRSLRTAEWNIVLGDRMAERLIGQGVREKTVRVIHNWADGTRIYPVNRDQNPLRSEWGLNGKFVVGYSGNFGRAHDFTTILDAAENLAADGSIMFLFIGSGAQRGQLEKEAQRRQLQNFIFKPYQPRKHLRLSLSAPDVHLVSLQPSLEGFIVPSKFYGITAAGRPTIFIGSSQGEIPRILKEARCGFSVEVGRADELVRIIRDLADHDELCLSLGRRAREIFDRKFDVGYAMQAWDEILERSA